MPAIPYFYHDITARIVPGGIQIALIAALIAYDRGTVDSSPSLRHLREVGAAVCGIAPAATALVGLAAAYFIGVVFEGTLFRFQGWLFRRAFSQLSNARRKESGIAGTVTPQLVKLRSEQLRSLMDSYEPVAPHFFARATRYLAEAKMLLFSACTIPTALVVRWALDRQIWPPRGWEGLLVALLSFSLLAFAGFSRQRRRAIELIDCGKYLAKDSRREAMAAQAKEAIKGIL